MDSEASKQLVVTGNSAIQLVEIDRGIIKDLFRSQRGDANPVCLPDGTGIAFVRETPSGKELFAFDLRHKQLSQITFGMDVRPMFSVSPDGKQLAYVSGRTKQVYVVGIESRQSTQLTTTFGGKDWGGPQAPMWSPDGKRLALAYFEKAPYESSFYVLDTLTRRLVSIPTPVANAPLIWAPWSPEGTKLALGGMSRTIIVDVSNDQPRVVREVTGYVQNVHWSPDGTKLAFEHGREGRYCDNVSVLNLQSGFRKIVNRRLLEYRCFHGPQWSPDSKNLAFLGYFSRGDMSLFGPESIYDQIYLTDTQNMTVRRLTNDLRERNYRVSWCVQAIRLDARSLSEK
jgi:Tol biopolymer transport system component